MVALRFLLLAIPLTAFGVAHAQPRSPTAAPAAPAAAPATPPASDPPLAPAPPATGNRARDDARRHFQQGVALYEEGNYSAALAEFQAAQQSAPAAIVLYNIGLTLKALYRYSEAAIMLERYLVETRNDARVTNERRQQVVQLIEEMKSLLAPVTFNLTPRSARITVDGRPMALTPDGTLELAAGSHVVDIVADGHESQRKEITVAAGVASSVDVQLTVIPRTGKVRITSSQSGTTIYVDGHDRGLAPLELELNAGGHQLEARADGYETYRGELVLAAGQERNVDLEMRLPPPEARPVYKKWWFWTGLGVAVAGGTATAFLLRPGTEPPRQGGLTPGGLYRADRK